MENTIKLGALTLVADTEKRSGLYPVEIQNPSGRIGALYMSESEWLSLRRIAGELATLERLQPLRTVLADWDWRGIEQDGRLPEGCEERVIAAFAHVERAESEAIEAERKR